MRPAVLVLLILLIGSVQLQTGCSPTPAPNLTGTWVWEYNANPSGSGSTMYLLDVSGTVTGTELDRGVGCCARRTHSPFREVGLEPRSHCTSQRAEVRPSPTSVGWSAVMNYSAPMRQARRETPLSTTGGEGRRTAA